MTDAVWLEDGIARDVARLASSILEQWDADLRLVNTRSFEGSPWRLLLDGDEVAVLTTTLGRPVFASYVPTDDGDGDGVPAREDAFPLDVAASLDSDGDGSPDAWNDGYGQADSTTGLTIDAFPYDSACQLPEHARADDPDTCDIANGVPAYTPDRIEIDDDGVVYLLSSENEKIFRWSLVEDYHLNPIAVGPGVVEIAYSPVNGRLYTAYDRAGIRQIDPADPSLAEQPFAASGQTLALQTVGAYVFAVVPGNVQRTFAPDGTPAYSSYSISASKEITWSAANSRIYYVPDSYTPRQIYARQIDASTGSLGGYYQTPYGSSNALHGPVRVSPDGARMVEGSGHVYDAISMQPLQTLPIDFDAAQWLDDGSGALVTLRGDGAGGSVLEQWGPDLRLENVQDFPGDPLRLLLFGDEVAVVTEVGGQPAFASYTRSDDGDADGVPNDEDAFPFDPAAALDSDGDGYPDAWNDGRDESDSTTGLTLDAFPFDVECQLPEHARPGDPAACDYVHGVPAYTPVDTEIDEDGVLYFLSGENERVDRWSLVEGYYLKPIHIGPAARQIAWSSENGRLYVSYQSGTIHQIDVSNPALAEQDFASTPDYSMSLQAAGRFLVSIDRRSHNVFAPDGTPVSSVPRYPYSFHIAWSEANARIYYFRDGSSPNDLYWEQIDPVTGAIGDAMETPYHGDYVIRPPIRVSPDGARVILGSGDVYDALSLEILDSLPIEFDAAQWLDDGSGALVTLRDDGAGASRLEQWDADLRLENLQAFEGTPLRALLFDDEVAIVTMIDGRPVVSLYVPTDDGDGDGVPSSEDAFPLDPAASVDSDNDGAPDAWNDGYGEADSTTGLVLDAFPFDSACQLPEHALPDDPLTCDIANAVPPYAPDRIEIDEEGVIYLLSVENEQIYRWSLAEGYHLNPISTGRDVRQIAYSAPNHRLYTAYESGEIRQIDLADPALREQAFGATPQANLGLQTAGAFVVAVDPSGAWDSHHTFAPDGTPISSVEWNYLSRDIAWSEVNARIYYFRDSSSPNDLYWEQIDPVTGEIGDAMETPYHGDYTIRPPIRVSPDGTRVILGSGDVYDAHSLEILESLPIEFDAAQWLDDGSGALVTLRGDGAGGSLLEQWDANLRLENIQAFPGDPLRLLLFGDEVAVVTEVGGQPAFARYTRNDDGDGDGVPSREDAFPLDPAASVDSDHDGAPDAWNDGYGEADSTTGLVLDAFPFDSACQLPEDALPHDPLTLRHRQCRAFLRAGPHRDRRGRGDLPPQRGERADLPLVPGRGLSPEPDPHRARRATVRLLGAERSPLHGVRQERGDPSDRSGGPIAVRAGLRPDAGCQPGPADRRRVRRGVRRHPPQLRARRNARLVWRERNTPGRSSGARSTRASTTSGTGLSPNDLYWQQIDPVTGELGGSLESPYHGVYTIRPPIRVSADGAYVLLGSGDLYDAISLEVVSSLPYWIEDADYGEELLVTIREDTVGDTIVEQWSAAWNLYGRQTLPGAPLRLLRHGDRYVVVTQLGGQPSFHDYVPSDDGDGDGVANAEDAFPTRPGGLRRPRRRRRPRRLE